ncbi:hypothetical protein LCGC14_1914060 [marine sediment metagenome]|uniref:Uncharacterized protein n=1 Tax=marine sediment metagenome TaxID=412755 RepID=A0A0F9GG01_9ZZZZ
MVEEDPLNWEIEPPENFLDSHFLYHAVHIILWINWPNLDKIHSNFFSYGKAEKGLSTDWNKYASPEDTLMRRIEASLEKNGIIELNISNLRNLIQENNFPMMIRHAPEIIPPVNRAHSLIEGIHKINKTKIKRKLSKIAHWAPNMKPIKV